MDGLLCRDENALRAATDAVQFPVCTCVSYLSFAPSSQRRVRNADLKRAAFEWTVTNMNTAANFCYIDCNRCVVHLDKDRISYHPWLQLIVMAGAYALQREAIPPEICALIASTVVMVEKLAPEDVFTAFFGTRLAC